MTERTVPENIEMSFQQMADEGIPTPNTIGSRPIPKHGEQSGVSSKPSRPQAGRIKSSRRDSKAKLIGNFTARGADIEDTNQGNRGAREANVLNSALLTRIETGN